MSEAFANLDRIKSRTIADANNAIPDNGGFAIYWCDGTHCPNDNDGVVITKAVTLGSTLVITQEWQNDSSNDIFVRTGIKNGTTVTWRDWEQLATKSDLAKIKTETIIYNGASFIFDIYPDKIVIKCSDSFSSAVNLSDWVTIGTLSQVPFSFARYATFTCNNGVRFKMMVTQERIVNIFTFGTISGFVQDEDVIYA